MNTQRISILDIKIDDTLVFTGPSSHFVVYDAEETHDGQIKVSIGYDGTGTMWFDPEEFVWILVD